jgi:Flp pilus assembly protein TadG
MQRSAQAMVEFALAVSVFMLLVLGTFDLSRAYLSYTVVTNAAREAGRYGAAHLGDIPQPGDPDWRAVAAQTGANMGIGLDSPLRLSVDATTIGGLAYVRVTGTYQFHSITPMVGALLGDPIPMRVDTSTLAG